MNLATPSALAGELRRLGAVLLLATLAGVAIGRPWLWACLGLAGLLAWHLYRLHVLLQRHAGERSSPELGGLYDTLDQTLHALTERERKSRRRLARFQDRFRQLAAALPDGVVILNRRDRIEWCNPATQGLLGIAWPDAARRPLRQFFPHPALDEHLHAPDASRPIELGSPVDKTRILSLQLAPFGKKHQRLLLARDITRVYLLDQSRKDFVANVSHELRTPLTVIRGYLEALEDLPAPSPEQARSIREMQHQAKRMGYLIDDLLSLSRLEMDQSTAPLDPVPIPEMLAVVTGEARTLSGAADHEIDLQADLDSWLLGDAGQLRSAISNLVFNAVRHTAPRTRVQVHWWASPTGAVLEVSDSGEGIATRHIPRLTERFYRVDKGPSRQSGGTGLGLAIVKHILNRHGATLHIYSEIGRGSTFRCQFPPDRVTRKIAGSHPLAAADV